MTSSSRSHVTVRGDHDAAMDAKRERTSSSDSHGAVEGGGAIAKVPDAPLADDGSAVVVVVGALPVVADAALALALAAP